MVWTDGSSQHHKTFGQKVLPHRDPPMIHQGISVVDVAANAWDMCC